MMVGMLVAGIGLVLAGLLAIGYGIPINEFSIGNTLIITGVIGVCTGVIMLGLWTAVRELKNIAQRLGTGLPEARGEATVRPVPAVAARGSRSRDGGFPAAEPFGGPRASPAAPAPPCAAAMAERGRLARSPDPEPCTAEAAAAPPSRSAICCFPRRREKSASAPRRDPASRCRRICCRRIFVPAAPTVPPVEPAEPPPATFDDAWPRADRARPGEFRRRGAAAACPRRSSSKPTAPTGARTEDQPEVTVLKSGVVDGMAYSLYSDGSIEAQMPEGMMRFASIDELRAHLDQRP